MTINLKNPSGKEVFRRLVATADVVVENFRPGVMDRLGLGYETLREVKLILSIARSQALARMGH